MVHGLRKYLLVPLALMMLLMGSTLPNMEAAATNMELKTATFLSPMFSTVPGASMELFYYNVDFPRGHIAMKAFFGEVIDEEGNPVPLYETYLHHCSLVRYYQHKDAPDPDNRIPYCDKFREPGFISAGNDGTCQPCVFKYYYGMGSESRNTSTYIQDPYGIELGNPAAIPPDYEERWVFNVHAIDTRGVVNRRGCSECWCDLFNVTVDQYGKPLKPGYTGGMKCCYENLQCRLSENSQGLRRRNLFLKYTIKYLNWVDSILPVKVYLLDVTDTWTPSNPTQEHNCAIEYSIEACYPTNEANDTCLATKRVRLEIPTGGYLIYASLHQHAGGIGGTLYGEDGRVLCSSNPTYGEGNEAGNEKGYIIGMSSCYPKPGSMKINDGEIVTFESNYAPGETHRGVMGIFDVMISDRLPPDPSIRMQPSMLAIE